MKGVQVVSARLGHACVMGKRANKEAVRLMGPDSRRHLADVFRASQWSRALMIDGRCVAIGGVIGPVLGPADVWLVIADEARARPRVLLAQGRRYVLELKARCGALVTRIIEDDAAAYRFAKHLGFRFSEVQEQAGVRFRVAMLGDL